jgi:hypothetical protein
MPRELVYGQSCEGGDFVTRAVNAQTLTATPKSETTHVHHPEPTTQDYCIDKVGLSQLH